MSTVILKLFVFLSKCSILSRIIVLFDLFFAPFFPFFRLFPQSPCASTPPFSPPSRAKCTRRRGVFRQKSGGLLSQKKRGSAWHCSSLGVCFFIRMTPFWAFFPKM